MASKNMSADVLDRQTTQGVCDKHGDFEGESWMALGRRLGPHCPTCAQDREDARVEKEKSEEEYRRASRLRQLKKLADIPKRFEVSSFRTYRADTDRQRHVLAVCEDYASRFDEHAEAGRCMLLLGRTGTGKTHLAIAIANRLIHGHGKTVLYRTLSGILYEIRASYDNNEASESKIMEELTGCDLLVIDEIGATKSTEFEMATLFAIINRRYENMMPTVVVSNLGPKQIPQAMGDRCVDRMRENDGIALVFDWDSKRAVREARQ